MPTLTSTIRELVFRIGLPTILLTAGPAKAGTIFDAITSLSSNGYGGIGPLGDSFTFAGGTITAVSAVLADRTPTDGGYIMVYITPNAAGNIPSSTGLTLTNKTLLGTILDSSLSANLSTVSLSTSLNLPAGTYWIELVGSDDTANGGNGILSNAILSWSVGTGVGLSGEFYSGPNRAGTAIESFSDTTGPWQISVNANTPEPGSATLLGFGLVAVLGFHRFKAKAADPKARRFGFAN